MTFTIPPGSPVFRLSLALLGIVVLLWSGVEDHDVITVAALGWLTSGLAMMHWLMSRFGGRILDGAALLKLAPVAGAAAGAFASLTTILLMLFKDLRHAHAYPDYPPRLMLGILERLPIWSVAGGLAGLGLCLLAIWLRHKHFTDAGDIKGAD